MISKRQGIRMMCRQSYTMIEIRISQSRLGQPRESSFCPQMTGFYPWIVGNSKECNLIFVIVEYKIECITYRVLGSLSTPVEYFLGFHHRFFHLASVVYYLRWVKEKQGFFLNRLELHQPSFCDPLSRQTMWQLVLVWER